MDIYLLSLILLVISKLIVDTQTQISGILFFNDQEQDITIWIRPQPQFLDDRYINTPGIPFAIINNKDGQDLIKFTYQTMDLSIIIFFEIQKQKFYLNKPDHEQRSQNGTWVKFVIHKTTEQIEFIQANEQIFNLYEMKLHQLNMIYSWQSLIFTCQIYDQIEQLDLTVLVLQNDVFLKQQLLRIFNSKKLIILLVYIRFQEVQKQIPFIQIFDEDRQIQIILNQTSIAIDFYQNYYKSFSKAFDSNMTNQWISITLFDEYQQTLCQLAFKDQYLEQIIYSPQYEEGYHALDQIKILGIIQYLQNYKIFVINKYFDSQKVILDRFCFQNCKTCNKLQCLECEGQLSLETNCLCPLNQHLHPTLGFCVDKTLTQNIKINNRFVMKFCPFGYFYDQKNLKCRECPKLNEFYCTSCLYNNLQWQPGQSCFYQEIFQQMFIQPELNFEFSKLLLIQKRYDKIPKQCFYEFSIDYQRLIVFYQRDIYRILFELCDQNYFFSQLLQKCKILEKGQQYGNQQQKFNMKICKIGFAYLNKCKCIKCQKNCLMCKLINLKLICTLPNKSYTLGQNQQIIKCQDNRCQEIDNKQYDECQVENCKVCYFSSCLVCNHNYVQDYNENCHLGSQFSSFFHIEINDNLVKPQYDHQQIIYLRYQLEKFKIDLGSDDILQIIEIGNNYKEMRQSQLPQQQNNYYYKDNQQVYCLNQTQLYGFKFCHQHVSGYQYIQQLNKYVYCHNQNCQFDLIYQVIVFFTNNPSIKYQNMTFVNFEIFAKSLSLNELFINNIIIEAIVYVFDTFQDNCEGSFFTISDSQVYNYQVILDFKGVSVFPNCQNSLIFEFNEISLINLFTYSSLQFEFTCNKVLIKNCTFIKQENLQLKIEASYVQLEQVYIQGILKEQYQHMINIDSPQLIQFIYITDLLIENINLSGKNIISIWSKTNNTQIEFVKLQNNKLIKSTFLRNYDTINIQIQSLIVDNMIFDQSGLILLLQVSSNLLTINNLIIQNSTVLSNSVLIQSDYLNLFNILFIDVQIDNSGLFFVNENLTIQNISFKQILLLQSFILKDEVNFISVIRFSIMNSIFVSYFCKLFQPNRNQNQFF
ncbi:hypothetical protein pb186bvf_008157 [Paramecium bursaria]